MLTGFRVLWRALVHFWDESILLLKANFYWFVLSLPLYLLSVLVCGLFMPPVNTEGEGSFLPWALAAFVIVVIPQPISAGVYAVANFVVNDETPEFTIFWLAIRTLWKRTLVMFLIGAGVFGGLLFNTSFYMQSDGVLQAVAILWFYAIIYWLTLQAYLLPLTVQAAFPPPPPIVGDDGWPTDDSGLRQAPAQPEAPEPELVPLGTLYKRAAVLALANPLLSLVLLFGTLFALVLSSFALPVYPLIVMSFVALIHARGLRALRDKYFPKVETQPVRPSTRQLTRSMSASEVLNRPAPPPSAPVPVPAATSVPASPPAVSPAPASTSTSPSASASAAAGAWRQSRIGRDTYHRQSGESLYQATELLKEIESPPESSYYLVETGNGVLGRDSIGYYTEASLDTENLKVEQRGAAGPPVPFVELAGMTNIAASQRVAQRKANDEYARLVLIMKCGRCAYDSPVETEPGPLVRECYRCGAKNTGERGMINVIIGSTMVQI